MSKTVPLNVKEFNLRSGKWNTYISQLTAWFDINEVKPESRAKYLIAVVGTETLDLIIDLCYPSEPDEVSYDDIVSKVREHLSPKRSELAERMCFRACKQMSDQSICEYVAQLKQLAQKCNFTGSAYLEENLRDQLAYGMKSEAIRFRLLTETKLTFSRAVEIATSLEAADRDSKASGSGSGAGATTSTSIVVKEEGVHAVRAGGGGGGGSGARAPPRRRETTAAAPRARCPRCLGPHYPRRCSFINTECYVCGKKGHIAKACRRRKAHSVNVCSESLGLSSEAEPEEDDEEYDDYDVPLYMIGGSDADDGPWWRTVKVNGVNVRMQLDSGSAVSVMSYKFCSKMFKDAKLLPTAINLKMYSGQKIVPKGILPCEVMYNNKTLTKLSLVVVDSKDSPPIMGRRWMTALGIECNAKPVFNVQSESGGMGTRLARAFPLVFAPGTGKFTGKPIHLTVTGNARPVLCRPRPVPHALRAAVEAELQRLQADGVISPVETSEWGTPVVPVIKQSGEIAWLSRGDGYSCPYGQNCAFEPAPPGRAPPCAQPGLTYCVHPDPYPEHVIRRLIEAGQYDISTLLSDETRDDFNSNKKVDYPYGYGPNSLPHVDQISIVNEPKNYNTKFHSRFNHEIFSQKTPLQPPSAVDPSPYNINAYQAANFSKFGFQNPNYWMPSFDYEKKVYRQNNVYNQNFYNAPFGQYDSADWFRQAAGGVTQYNPNEWWKYMSPSRADVTVERSVTFPTRSTTSRHVRRRRNAELVRAAAKRKLTGAEALRIALGLASAETSAERPRRQAPGTEELCRVRTDYITPRAALNNKGSWRYVVNMPDNMTQLVRAEICTSSECSNLCSVPVGYSSRCEQKYIQKRLVALESSGQNLYTDIFWIPSCCQCTIIANNT